MTSLQPLPLFIGLLAISLSGCTRDVPKIEQPRQGNATVLAPVASGTVVIEPQFAEANAFENGMARVTVGVGAQAVQGYIDRNGTFKINPKYKYADSFSDGLAAVDVGNGKELSKWGFLDRTGKIVIEPQFARSDGFKDGTAIVVIGNPLSGLSGLIDEAGHYVINPQYNVLSRLNKNRFAYQASRDGQYGIVDGHGRIVLAPQFTSLWDAGNGLARASSGTGKAERCGYVNDDGKVVINFEFLRCTPFSEGLAAVVFNRDGQSGWGYVDESGRLVIKTPYGLVENFHDGLAAVAVGDREENAKWGFIDKHGVMAIQAQFDEVFAFNDGRAIVRIGGGGGEQKRTEMLNLFSPDKPAIVGKWGAIDTTGHYVVNPRFDAMGETKDKLAPARVGDHISGKWGFVQL